MAIYLQTTKGPSPHPYLWQICLLQPARRRPTAAAQGSVTINMAAGSVGEPPHSPWHPTQPQPQPHPLQPLIPPPPHWPLLPSRVYYTPAWCYLRLLPSPPRVPGVSSSPLLLCYYFLPDLLTPSSPPSSTVLHIFSIRRQGLASPGENRVPPSRARPPRLRSLMPFTTKLTLTFLALALLALAHGHSTGTNQRASPPAPRRVFSS